MKYLGSLLVVTALSSWPHFASGNRGNLNVDGEIERELTFEIGAGREECFYETVKKGNIIDIEYQVIDGGQANDLRIDFRLIRPDGVPLVADFGKSDTAHRNAAEIDGDYKICFDNTKARFGAKIVFFGIIIENDDDDDYNIEGRKLKTVSEEFYGDVSQGFEVKVQDIESSLGTIREKMSRSRHLQDQLKAFEYRDRSVAEHNFERINFWSILQLIVMLLAGVVQVILVRSIFDDKSAIHKFWRNRE